MTGHEQPFDVTDSDQETDGDMGVSSETEGLTGPGQHGTTGTVDTSEEGAEEGADDGAERPEQSAGGVEVNPDPPVPPRSGYNSRDPRSGDAPYGATPDV